MEVGSKPEKPSDWKDSAAFFVLRVSDSGLIPWVLAALFLLGGLWTVTRNLDSDDTFAFLAALGSWTGFAWAGWLVAFLEIPLGVWVVARVRRVQAAKLERLLGENRRARDRLKELKQEELDLEP